jgi:hypothetical protein
VEQFSLLYETNSDKVQSVALYDHEGKLIEIGTPVVVYKSSINQGTGSVAISQPAETRVINEQGVEVTPESSAADTTTGTTTDTMSDPTSYTAIDGQ